MNNGKCRCECQELIDKRICNKGFICNPSNSEYECDKLWDVGEYLDYKNCKCRKRLIDKLVQCTLYYSPYFHNKYKHWQCFYLLSLVFKKNIY